MQTNQSVATEATVSLKGVTAMKTFYKTVFSQLNGERSTFMAGLTVDVTTRKAKKAQIGALMSTGLFSKEELVQTLAKVSGTEKDIQILILNSWITSDNLPDKEVCMSLMNAFAADKPDLMAEILLTREKDFPLNVIAKILIDGSVPLTEACYISLAEQVERLSSRATK